LTLLAPWFLAALAALAPLVALHLRRRRREQDVASLLLWRDIHPRPPAAPRRRSARLVLPLLLLLQALFLVLLVVALTRPGDRGGARSDAGAAPAVFVLDGSIRMAMTDVAPDRLAAARAELGRRLARLPDATPVSVVVAGTAPRLLVAGVGPRAARAALARAGAGAPTADLPAALALAAGQLHRRGGTITLVRAAGDASPRVLADGVAFSAVAIGGRADNQALARPVARCVPGARPTCSVFAVVRNEASATVHERLLVERDGRSVAARDLTIAPGASAEVAFAAAAGARLTLRLMRRDALAADNRALVDVPAVAAPVAVTLVSSRPTSAPLARALAAALGVTLRRIAPSAYTSGDARSAGLLVLDRWLPAGSQLPPARAQLLVAPPRLPAGRVGASVADASPSGEDAADPLLSGVDLSALAIASDGLRRIALPPALRAIAWAPGGPLLAAGDAGDGEERRVALLALDPQRSNLPQLPAFPILLANVVDWARGQATVDPGGGAAASATSSPTATSTPVVLRATDGGGNAPGRRSDWWPWLAAAALLVLLAEWAYPWLAERGARRRVSRR
jgi:Ca-activated chloride channel family protein